MNLKCLAVAFATTVVGGICNAQTTQSVLEDFKPSVLNQPGQEYPEVNSQGYVRFRIKAPKADSVKVSLGLGGRGGTRLKKSDDGYWTGRESDCVGVRDNPSAVQM
jgi:1,4-alpha-glucan branching enzyme